MKPLLAVSLLIIAVLQSSVSQMAFLPPIGPEGTSIAALAKDSSGNLYAAGARIYRSTDNGGHWTPIAHEMNWSAVGITKEGTIYAGTGNGGAVMRSTNGGAEWNYVSGVMGQSIHCITVDPAGRIYVGSNTGLYRSTDGVNFTFLQSVLQNITYGVHFEPDGVYFASTMSGIFRSSDHGDTWAHIGTTLPNNYSLIRTASGAFIAAMGGGLYRSTDRCATWSKVHDTPFVYSLVMEDGNNLYAGGFNAMLRSTDGGLSWESRDSGLTDRSQKHLFVPVPGTVMTANRTGVNVSTDHGAAWRPSNGGFGIIQTRAFVIGPNGHYFAGTAGGVYRSTDAGATWTGTNAGLLYQSVYLLKVFEDGTLFLSPDNGLYRSTDDGETWELLSGGLSDNSAETIHRHVTGTLITTQSFAMYRSTDNGSTWTPVNTAGVATSFVSGPDSALYGTDGIRIIRSTDDGLSWSEWSRWAYRATDLSQNGVGHQFAADDYNGIFRSTDLGRTWQNVMDAPNNSHMQHVAVNRNGWIYASNELGELYESRTTGRTWALAASFGARIGGLYLDKDDHLHVIVPKAGTYRSGTSTAPSALPSLFIAPVQEFGRRRIKQQNDSVLTFYNPGTDTLRVTGLTAASPFVPAGGSFTVPPYGVHRDTVRFTLPGIGPHSGTVIISHNAVPQPDTVQVRAFGFGKPVLRFSGDSLRFPAVIRPGRKDSAVTVYNDGDDTLFMTAKNVSPSSFTSRTAIAPIPPGAAYTDSLRFQPTGLGLIAGTMIVTSNTEPGADTLPMAGTGIGYPNLVLPSRSVSFGTVNVGTVKSATVFCSNNGYDTLKISSIASTDSAFTSMVSSLIIPPTAAFVPVTLRYTPAAAGTDTGLVILTSNDPGGADTIRVAGNGIVLGAGPEPVMVTEYGLDQNYPNPFNPTTVIPFRVLSAGRTTLRVHDMLGRLVMTLFDRDVPMGTYTAPFSGDGLPSGVYFCTMRSGPFSATRKLVLSK